MLKKEKEELEMNVEEEKRKGEEREKRVRELESQLKEEVGQHTEDMRRMVAGEEGRMKNGGRRITLVETLEGMEVSFGDGSKMRIENNSIIHNNERIWVSGFIGGKLDDSVHRMFELFFILSLYLSLIIILIITIVIII